MAIKKKVNGTWQSINPKQLKGIPYTGTLPAVLAGTKAGYLHKYKIYGNLTQNGTPSPSDPIVPSECGERTGNLFDSGWEQGYISVTTGENQPSNNVVRTAGYIPVEYNKVYSMSRNLSSGVMSLRFYDAQKSYITGGSDSSDVMQLISGQSYNYPMATNSVFCCFKITDNRVAYIRVHDYTNSLNTQYMMAEGEYTEQTMPTYIPYGYKLPLTSGNTPVDIYIGDTPLGTDEYVDYGTQKIYKDVDIWNPNGTTINNQGETRPGNTLVGNIKYSLKNNSAYTFYYRIGASSTSSTAISAGTELSITPSDTLYIWSPVSAGMTNFLAFTKQFVDPPVPFPQIPTTANSTTISWGGSGLAPSEFDSIQEWVDILTYKRVNGEWVADN